MSLHIHPNSVVPALTPAELNAVTAAATRSQLASCTDAEVGAIARHAGQHNARTGFTMTPSWCSHADSS